MGQPIVQPDVDSTLGFIANQGNKIDIVPDQNTIHMYLNYELDLDGKINPQTINQ